MKLKTYQSDVTKFVNNLLAQNPEIVQKQKQARAMWWNKPADFEERRRNQESQVPQQGYYYQAKS